MKILTPVQTTQWIQHQQSQGLTIGLVPTMGALHPGHLSLVAQAKQENDCVCVSIFVNPLQFNNQKDLDNYPNTLEQDTQLLQQAGCDVLFTGSFADFFPEYQQRDDVPQESDSIYSQGLEGRNRPGHFSGVITIVRRLFKIAPATNAYFGEKDYEQTLVVKQLVKELADESVAHPTIIVCPIIREPSGLAMSSRNERLNKADRQTAALIYQALLAGQARWQDGIKDVAPLLDTMKKTLEHPDIEIEYIEIREDNDWQPELDHKSVISPRVFIAVLIGGVRLIDNMAFTL